MGNTLHFANAKGRNASVGLTRQKPPLEPTAGVPGETLTFRRYLAATDAGSDAALKQRFGDDYGAALLAGDPEVDMEAIGRAISDTSTVYLDAAGDLMYVDPSFIEVIVNPDGSEKERRTPQEVASNTSADVPLKWSGKKIPIADAVRRFMFKRTLQLRHVDGLTFDFLYEMAAELEQSSALMLLGSGEKGIGPLVFQANGRGYRGFLEGRTDGKRYQLLLHLSDMELKVPAVVRKPKVAEADNA